MFGTSAGVRCKVAPPFCMESVAASCIATLSARVVRDMSVLAVLNQVATETYTILCVHTGARKHVRFFMYTRTVKPGGHNCKLSLPRFIYTIVYIAYRI